MMFSEDDVIFAYARSEALADGVLVDVSDMAREAGFRYPVAVTQAVWADIIPGNPASPRTTCGRAIVGHADRALLVDQVQGS